MKKKKPRLVTWNPAPRLILTNLHLMKITSLLAGFQSYSDDLMNTNIAFLALNPNFRLDFFTGKGCYFMQTKKPGLLRALPIVSREALLVLDH